MKKLLLVAGIAVVGVAGWRLHSRGTDVAASDGGARLVTDRIWVDHVPKNDRDQFQVFAMISDEPVGVFQLTSMWQGAFDAFRYDARGGEIRAVFPQTGKSEKFKATARECNEQGMDYCLELRGADHGVKRYYSHEGWEIGSLADEQKFVRHLY